MYCDAVPPYRGGAGCTWSSKLVRVPAAVLPARGGVAWADVFVFWYQARIALPPHDSRAITIEEATDVSTASGISLPRGLDDRYTTGIRYDVKLAKNHGSSCEGDKRHFSIKASGGAVKQAGDYLDKMGGG